MFRCHSYRTHEKTSISYNKNREIRVNDDGQTLPSARYKALKKANLTPDIFPTPGEILDNQQMDPIVDNAKERRT
jgi:hypothetical protein